MAKRQKRNGKQSTVRNAPSKTPVRRHRRYPKFRNILISVVLLASFGLAVAAYNSHQNELHDLSVIGGGVPTVVQIHDPGCPICRELRRNVRSAGSDLNDDEMLFRIANIKTDSGRAMAARHNVSHATLLIFDAEGGRIDTVQGAMSSAGLRALFARHKRTD